MIFFFSFLFDGVQFQNIGTFVLLWRRGSSVLTAGHLKITRDDRFKIVDDYNLQISNVKTQDAGDYICQIGDQETRDQVHTVEILGRTNRNNSISRKNLDLSFGQMITVPKQLLIIIVTTYKKTLNRNT